jgi:NAD dependent epimerase/dehydratase family enzyme
MFGEVADAALLSSCRVVPTKALESGYVFQFADLLDAIRFECGISPGS